MLFQIYPWTKIQEAHREMEANKNRFVNLLSLRVVLTPYPERSGKIVAEVV